MNLPATTHPKKLVVTSIILALTFIGLVQTAWISDDAKITFRYVMNFIHGYGPVFNIGDRVQGYTHPLWFFIISIGTWMSGNVYYTTLVLSFALTLFLVWFLLWKVQKTESYGWLWILALLLSKAFMDFSTSGLENSLSNTMVVVGFWSGLYFLETSKLRYAFFSSILLCSIYLSRPDLILIVIPFWFFIVKKTSRDIRSRLVVFSVFLVFAWTAFSLFYYGFPFPNTAYAKLANGISRFELIKKGAFYFYNSLQLDPITMIVMGTGIFFGIYKSKPEITVIVMGVLIYFLYVLFIGGDFMTGRFFTVPLVVSVLILSRHPFRTKLHIPFAIIILFFGYKNFSSIYLEGPTYSNLHFSSSGVADERGYYYQETGLLSPARQPFQQPFWGLSKSTVKAACGDLGKNALNSGPSTYFVDICGLTDSLLARMPPLVLKLWRVGHFLRQIPTNYELAILEKDDNVMLDSNVRAYWRVLKNITRGPLISTDRFKTIAEMNLGLISKPNFQTYATDPTNSKIVSIVDLQKLIKRPVSFYFCMGVDLVKPMSISAMDFTMDGMSGYSFEYKKNDKYETFLTVNANQSLVNHQHIKLDQPTPPISEIKIVPFNPLLQHEIGPMYLY